MKLRILVVAGIVAAIALFPATAWAKGAKSVTITGPGLAQPVRVESGAGPSTVEVNRLASATGFFFAAFNATPNPMTSTRPPGRLGPRYRAVYELYVAQDKTMPVRQDLYPFAAAGFVAYTPPRQHIEEKKARSGWYVTTPTSSVDGLDSPSATAMLVALGAPDRRAGSARGAGRG